MGTFYGGTDGTLLYSGAPAFPAAGADGHPADGALGGAHVGTPANFHASAHAPPRFYKLEFANYDGAVDCSTSVSSFFGGSAPSPPIACGWPSTTFVAWRKHGTMFLNKMRACLYGSDSMSCASFASGTQRRALICRNSLNCRSPPPSRTTQSATMLSSTMSATSTPVKRLSCTWAVFLSTSGLTWRCTTRRTSNLRCTTCRPMSGARRPSSLLYSSCSNSGAAVDLDLQHLHLLRLPRSSRPLLLPRGSHTSSGVSC